MKKCTVPLVLSAVLLLICLAGFSQKEFYEIRVYKIKSDSQMTATDNYLKDAYIPTMHHLGFRNIGVFKPVSNDTAVTKLVYVLTTYKSLDVWRKTKQSVESDPVNINETKAFNDPDTAHVPFERVSSTLLEAFPDQEKLIPTPLKTGAGTVYELRSYESPTEELHRVKVDMFNAGGEIALFKKLDCNAVFYAEVLSGNKMPNFMYMLSFASVAEQKAHWKAFGESKEWKKLSGDPVYRNNISVSHIDSITMQRTPYSDL